MYREYAMKSKIRRRGIKPKWLMKYYRRCDIMVEVYTKTSMEDKIRHFIKVLDEASVMHREDSHCRLRKEAYDKLKEIGIDLGDDPEILSDPWYDCEAMWFAILVLKKLLE